MAKSKSILELKEETTLSKLGRRAKFLRLIKGICKDLQLTLTTQNKQTNKKPLKSGQKDLNRHFSKEDIQRAKQVHVKMLNITSH